MYFPWILPISVNESGGLDKTGVSHGQFSVLFKLHSVTELERDTSIRRWQTSVSNNPVIKLKLSPTKIHYLQFFAIRCGQL